MCAQERGFCGLASQEMSATCRFTRGLTQSNDKPAPPSSLPPSSPSPPSALSPLSPLSLPKALVQVVQDEEARAGKELVSE